MHSDLPRSDETWKHIITVNFKKIERLHTGITTMAPAGRKGYPKATIGTPKGDRVDHNRPHPPWRRIGSAIIIVNFYFNILE